MSNATFRCIGQSGGVTLKLLLFHVFPFVFSSVRGKNTELFTGKTHVHILFFLTYIVTL